MIQSKHTTFSDQGSTVALSVYPTKPDENVGQPVHIVFGRDGDVGVTYNDKNGQTRHASLQSDGEAVFFENLKEAFSYQTLYASKPVGETLQDHINRQFKAVVPAPTVQTPQPDTDVTTPGEQG